MALNFANNNSLSAITTLPASISGGAMTLISEQTASGSATIDFTSGIDDTYDSYVFKFINIHPENDTVEFQFQGDTGTNTNYNQTITSTYFRTYHDEADTATGLAYYSVNDQAQGTGYQDLTDDVGNGNDESLAGSLFLYNPSSTTFVKHFIATTTDYNSNDHNLSQYIAGYFNTTSAITRISFKFEAGNIDSGDICLYGIA